MCNIMYKMSLEWFEQDCWYFLIHVNHKLLIKVNINGSNNVSLAKLFVYKGVLMIRFLRGLG